MKGEMNELALFAGAGGGILGGRLLGWRTVCAVEINPYRRSILCQRQNDGILSPFPIWDDVRTFDGKAWAGAVDVVSAGFPCQPFSSSGRQLGKEDPRNMWPETCRVISEVRPEHVLLENVTGIRKYLPVVIDDLRRIGYTVKRPVIVAAASVGAGHIRRRIWIYANSNPARQPDLEVQQTPQEKISIGRSSRLDDSKAVSSNANQNRELQPEGGEQEGGERSGDGSWWETEPDVVRVVYGIPNGMDRISALGDGQVPQAMALAWKILTEE